MSFEPPPLPPPPLFGLERGHEESKKKCSLFPSLPLDHFSTLNKKKQFAEDEDDDEVDEAEAMEIYGGPVPGFGDGAAAEAAASAAAKVPVPPSSSGGVIRHPHANKFLEYVKARRVVTFKRLSEPKEAGFELELSGEMSYDDVTNALAAALRERAEKQAEEEEAEEPAEPKEKKKSSDGGGNSSASPPPPVDGDHVRLTQHNGYTGGPKPGPVRHRGVATLDAALVHYQTPSTTLYYEVIDMPLPQLELLKPLRVEWFPAGGVPVSHTLMLPRAATVADALRELAAKVGDDASPERRPFGLRLVEIYCSKIFKVFDPTDRVDTINDCYWTLRAEPVEEDEVVSFLSFFVFRRLFFFFSFSLSSLFFTFSLTILHPKTHSFSRQLFSSSSSSSTQEPLPADARMVHVYHFSVDAAAAPAVGAPMLAALSAGSAAATASPAAPAPAALLGPAAGGPASPHGDPFFVRVGDRETLADVKPRIRARLRGAGVAPASGGGGGGDGKKAATANAISDKEWASWKFAVCFANRSPEYLADDDVISSRLPAKQARGCNQGNDTSFLGLEHAAGAGGGRARGAARRGGGGGGGFEKAIKIH